MVAWAEVIVLKDGKRVEGKILSETDEVIEVRVSKYGITMTQKVYRTQIQSIVKEGEEGAPPTAEPPAAKTDEEGPEKPAATQATDEDRTEAPKTKVRPIHIDLQMALYEPLIRDTFEDGTTKMEPRVKDAFFVLLPFRYEAEEEPYTITTRTLNFIADQGSARCRGLVPLESKAAPSPAGQKTGAKKGPGPQDQEDQPVELHVVKGSPVYERITVYEDDGELRVAFYDQPKSPSEAGGQKTSPRTVSGADRTAHAGTPRRSYSSAGRRSPAVTPRSGGGADQSRRESERPMRGYERAYGRQRETPRESPEDKEAPVRRPTVSAETQPATQRTVKDRTAPKDGKPGSGWAAMVLEVSNEAAVITAHVGPDSKVVVELRLIDALGRSIDGSQPRKGEDDLTFLQTVAEYAAHESPALSRVAVSQLTRLRTTPGRGAQPSRSPDKDAEHAELDKRSVLIESSLVGALASKDERTQRLAWRALISSDALPKATETVIAGLEHPEVISALLRLADQEVKQAGHILPAGEAARPTRMPSAARGGQSGSPTVYTPVGLPESSVPPTAWEIMGALLRVGDEKAALQAASLLLADGSRQAVSMLGQSHADAARRVVKVLAKTPNTPAKHQAVRMVLAGILGAKTRKGMDEALTGLAGVAQQMAAAGDPLRADDPGDVLMAAVPVLRDPPEWQLRALNILPWCRLDAALESATIEKWLTEMTDKLVDPSVQHAVYTLVALQWQPNDLPPLNVPSKPAGSPAVGEERVPPAGSGRLALKGLDVAKGAEGVVEKFLVRGFPSVPEHVRLAILTALLRANRTETILSLLEGAQPSACAGVLKSLRQMTAGAPPSLVPGQVSQFLPLSLMTELGARQKDPAFLGQVVGILGELWTANQGSQGWRLPLAFKRTFQWEVVFDLCLASEPKVAEEARKVVGALFGLAEGETTAIAGIKDRTALAARFDEYDKQRGAKVAGKYQGLVLCEALVPSYNLVVESVDDPEAKERGGRIANLTWRRQVLAVEPGVFDVVVGPDRKIEVRLGQAVVGTGEVPSGKEDTATQSPAAAKPELRALQEAMRQRGGLGLKAGKAPAIKAASEPQTPSFDIHLGRLLGAMMDLPDVQKKVPLMDLSRLAEQAKGTPLAKPKDAKEGAAPPDPFACPMFHLAFGTHQGAIEVGEAKPPAFDKPEVRVDSAGRIIRGAQPLPVPREIQIFLEPVRGESPGK